MLIEYFDCLGRCSERKRTSLEMDTPVSNKFWHSAAASERSEEKVRDNWMGVVHHVCGEHKWNCGSCNHGSLLNEEPDDYLSK